MSGWLTRLDPGAGGMRDWGWVGEVLPCSLSLSSLLLLVRLLLLLSVHPFSSLYSSYLSLSLILLSLSVRPFTASVVQRFPRSVWLSLFAQRWLTTDEFASLEVGGSVPGTDT